MTVTEDCKICVLGRRCRLSSWCRGKDGQEFVSSTASLQCPQQLSADLRPWGLRGFAEALRALFELSAFRYLLRVGRRCDFETLETCEVADRGAHHTARPS